MRAGLVFILIAVVLAGCTKDETTTTSTPPPTTTTPSVTTPEATPTPAATPTPTPTPTTPAPTGPTTQPTPTPPAPFVNLSLRHNFGNATENLTFFIPAGASKLNVSVQFDTAPTAIPGQFICSPGLHIKVIRPDGSLQFDVVSSPGSGANVHCGQVSAAQITFPTDVPPGEWHADFSAQGVGIGWVRVEEAV